jgi:tRNA modification GTPase
VANDTIVALATAPGEAAVALLRLSGPDALSIAARHFSGRRSPERSPSHRILHGTFLDASGRGVDAVLLSIFRSPRSYTGEDIVEIGCHGGLEAPRLILEILVAAGARPARPGEFTERAYRNGKLDLAQAEAVAALVRARSERSMRAARAALGGELTRRIGSIDGRLVPHLSEVEARIDFPGDVAEAIDAEGLAGRAAAIAAEVAAWLTSLPSARRRDEGLSVAIVGRPNVGKSSLLNALAGHDRAIVSERPGTTRDTVETTLWLDGVMLRVADTAGLRSADDPVERLGLERARRAAERSDLGVLVLDRSAGVRLEDDAAAAAAVAGKPVIVAWNKADLAGGPRAGGGPGGGAGAGEAGAGAVPPPNGARALLSNARVLSEVETVAIRPGGAEPLREALRSAAREATGGTDGAEIPTTSARQERLLAEALEALTRAERGLRRDGPCDLIAADLTAARRALGEIVGRGVDDALVAEIFARFCIGK